MEEFLLLTFYGMKDELLRLTNRSTISTIGLSDVKSIRIALPTIGEQNEILSKVYRCKCELENDCQTVARSIGLLSEYRSAVITEAVTGQLTELR